MTMRVRMVLMLMVGLAMMGLASCDHFNCSSGATFGASTCTPGTTGTGSKAEFVYFAGGAQELALAGLNVNNSGTFEEVSSFVSPTLTSGAVGMVVVNTKYLYVATGSNTVDGFLIDGTTGALTAVSGNPFGVGSLTTINSLAADPTGRFLFVGGLGGVSVFTVNASTGGLVLTTGSPFPTPGGAVPAQMATDGLGKYLYGVESFPGTEVLAFSYDQSSGALTAVPGSPFVSAGTTNFNMAEIAGESSGKYMVGITEEVGQNGGVPDNHIYVFGISQTTGSLGALTPVAGSPFATTNPPIFMAVSPNGAFVYTFNETISGSNGSIDAMEGYKLSGLPSNLPALTTSPFTGLDATIGRFDQSGEFLFAQATGASNIGETFPYTADPTTGALTSTLPTSVSAAATLYVVTDAQ